MKIRGFKIQNFKNIEFAKGDNLPDFVVICGGNGSGKSSILEAILAHRNSLVFLVDRKSNQLRFDVNSISADKSFTYLEVEYEFSDEEREFIRTKYEGRLILPKTYRSQVHIQRIVDPNLHFDPNDIDNPHPNNNVSINNLNPNEAVNHILYDHKSGVSVFDYFSAIRDNQKQAISNWQGNHQSKQQEKQVLLQERNKFNQIKHYLVGIKIDDLRRLQLAQKNSKEYTHDSLESTRKFFKRFFAPMEFVDVDMTQTPFKFIIKTPRGEIDIDGLSSGEKEVLFTFVHFERFKTRDSIILFDEPDAHLHPELERNYLLALKELSASNQFFITTHSPNMMAETPANSLFTILKYVEKDVNQFTQVIDSDRKQKLLSEIMGSKGFVSLNRKIVFIEGENSSADIDILEKFYPPAQYNISFIPAGNSSTVQSIAEKVNFLLTESFGYEQFYSIIDGDYMRLEDDPTDGSRLFKLPVYHIENLLLNSEMILNSLNRLKGNKCPYSRSEEVTAVLRELVLSENHLRAFARAAFDFKIALINKEIKDSLYKAKSGEEINYKFNKPDFEEILLSSREELEASLVDDSWRTKCKGRDLLKNFCGLHSVDYRDFRNLLLAEFDAANPPQELKKIMMNITSDSISSVNV